MRAFDKSTPVVFDNSQLLNAFCTGSLASKTGGVAECALGLAAEHHNQDGNPSTHLLLSCSPVPRLPAVDPGTDRQWIFWFFSGVRFWASQLNSHWRLN
jgi:hypothetical protein